MQAPVLGPEAATIINQRNTIDPSSCFLNFGIASYGAPSSAMSQMVPPQFTAQLSAHQHQFQRQMSIMMEQQKRQRTQKSKAQRIPSSPDSLHSTSSHSQASDLASMLNDDLLLPFNLDDLNDPTATLSPRDFSPQRLASPVNTNQNQLYYGLTPISMTTNPPDNIMQQQGQNGSPIRMRSASLSVQATTQFQRSSGADESMSAGSPSTVMSMEGMETGEDKAVLTNGKRVAHIQAEQKRRNQIRDGFIELQNTIPNRNQTSASGKFSKATVLHKAVDYISYLIKEKTGLMAEIDKVRKEVQQLRLVITQYQEMADSGAGSAELDEKLLAIQREMQSADNSAVSDQQQDVKNYDTESIKFYVFCCVIDTLFDSFSEMVSLENAEDFSLSLMSWFEDYCGPDSLRTTFLVSLQTIGGRLFSKENTRTLRRVSGAITACKEVMVTALDNSSVPYAKKLGQTIDYMGSICSLDSLQGDSLLRVSPANASI